MTLTQQFANLRSRREKALVLFFTAGDQPLEDLPAIVDTLTEAGADVIEIGIPFSDPFGEGPTIQASSQRALDNGATPRSILAALKTCKLKIPIVTMGYYNPVLRMGLRQFAQASRDSGSVGTIVSDLVPDESGAWCTACQEAGIDTIFLAAPTSTPHRILEVAQKSTGFVYAVSRTGVTGAENQVPADVEALVSKIRAQTNLPICVGFGISKPEHVRMVCQVSDGAVVGSFLVDLLHRVWNGGQGRAEIIREVTALKQATC